MINWCMEQSVEVGCGEEYEEAQAASALQLIWSLLL